MFFITISRNNEGVNSAVVSSAATGSLGPKASVDVFRHFYGCLFGSGQATLSIWGDLSVNFGDAGYNFLFKLFFIM